MAYLEFLTLTFKNKFSSFCSSRISGLLKSRANPPFNLSFLFLSTGYYRMSWILMAIEGAMTYLDSLWDEHLLRRDVFLVTGGQICKPGSLFSQSRKHEEEWRPEGVKICAVREIW